VGVSVGLEFLKQSQQLVRVHGVDRVASILRSLQGAQGFVEAVSGEIDRLLEFGGRQGSWIG